MENTKFWTRTTTIKSIIRRAESRILAESIKDRIYLQNSHPDLGSGLTSLIASPSLIEEGSTFCAGLSSHVNAYVHLHKKYFSSYVRYSKFRNSAVANQAKSPRTVRYLDLFPASAALKQALPAALQEISAYDTFRRMNPLLSGKRTRNRGQFLVLLLILYVHVKVT